MKNVIMILVWMSLVSGSVYAEDAKSPHPKAIMTGIFQEISYLLPISLKDKGLESSDPKEVSQRFQRLVDLSNQLDRESKSYGDNFSNLAQNFRTDLNRARWYFENKKYAKSSFLLQNLTETCFACHSKYPAEPHSGNPDSFYKQINLADFDDAEKSKIFTITRQFDKAQKTYEKILLADPKSSFEDIQYVLENLINVVMGNTRDFGSLKNVLVHLQKQFNQDHQAQMILQGWVRDLGRIESNKKWQSPTLDNARFLVKEARGKTDYASDKSGMLYWALATSILNQVTTVKHSPEVDSELYYWLGVSATMFEHSLWVAQMPYFLEHAVRLYPAGDSALKALDLLDKNTTYAFTGSSGTNIPADELKKLSDLRALVQKARKP